MTGGGAITTGWTMGAGRPKMPVPEMIWLNTANAPRPRAASVDEPASATPGNSSIAIRTTAATRLMALPPSCRRPLGLMTAGASRPPAYHSAPLRPQVPDTRGDPAPDHATPHVRVG